MTITPEEIAEWRKVCEEATAGYWECDEGDLEQPATVYQDSSENGFPIVAEGMLATDAWFAVKARTAMPRLLDELAAKDALIAKYEATLSEIVSVYGNDMDAVVESMMRKQNKALQASDES